MAYAILLAFIAALIVPGILRQRARAKRRAALAQRFGPQIADVIMSRQVWQGQTEQMLLESRGAPAGIDEAVLKTKVKRTYKYEPRPGRRFAFKVTVENGVAVGWDDKR